MNHTYELRLYPTDLQAQQLRRQAELLDTLRTAVRRSAGRLGATLPTVPGLEHLPLSLLEHTAHLERRRVEHERARGIVHPAADSSPRPPVLVGPGLVQIQGSRHLSVLGVTGPVQTELDQLPPWAQAVAARESGEGAHFTSLVAEVPTLNRARRADWADLRLETSGWVVELALEWDAFPAGTLMRLWEDSLDDLRGLRATHEVARLMGWDFQGDAD